MQSPAHLLICSLWQGLTSDRFNTRRKPTATDTCNVLLLMDWQCLPTVLCFQRETQFLADPPRVWPLRKPSMSQNVTQFLSDFRAVFIHRPVSATPPLALGVGLLRGFVLPLHQPRDCASHHCFNWHARLANPTSRSLKNKFCLSKSAPCVCAERAADGSTNFHPVLRLWRRRNLKLHSKQCQCCVLANACSKDCATCCGGVSFLEFELFLVGPSQYLK